MGPVRPEPGCPDLPSTPSSSTAHVNPGGSGATFGTRADAAQYFTASSVNSLTCSGHLLNGWRAIIDRTILE